MIIVDTELQKREESGRPVRVVIIGAGPGGLASREPDPPGSGCAIDGRMVSAQMVLGHVFSTGRAELDLSPMAWIRWRRLGWLTGVSQRGLIWTDFTGVFSRFGRKPGESRGVYGSRPVRGLSEPDADNAFRFDPAF